MDSGVHKFTDGRWVSVADPQDWQILCSDHGCTEQYLVLPSPEIATVWVINISANYNEKKWFGQTYSINRGVLAWGHTHRPPGE